MNEPCPTTPGQGSLRKGRPVRVVQRVLAAGIELFLAYACILAGIPAVFNPDMYAPETIQAMLPVPVVFFWGVMLVLGGVFYAVGVLWDIIRLQMAGLAALSSGVLVYLSSVVVIVDRGPSLLFILTNSLFIGAAIGKFVYLRGVLKLLDRLEHNLKERHRWISRH